MSDDLKRRLAVLLVEPKLFLDLCMATEWPRVTTATGNALPEGVELVGVNYDNILGCFRMGLRHCSFDVVPINEEPPMLPPVEVTTSLGDYMWMKERLEAAETARLTAERERDAAREAIRRGGSEREDGVWHRFTCMDNPCSYVCEAQRLALTSAASHEEG